MATKIKGGGARKYDRNRAWCAAYKSRQQRERNKALKLARHIRRYPWDQAARDALSKLPQSFQKGLDLPAIKKSPATLRKEVGITLTKLRQRSVWEAA